MLLTTVRICGSGQTNIKGSPSYRHSLDHRKPVKGDNLWGTGSNGVEFILFWLWDGDRILAEVTFGRVQTQRLFLEQPKKSMVPPKNTDESTPRGSGDVMLSKNTLFSSQVAGLKLASSQLTFGGEQNIMAEEANRSVGHLYSTIQCLSLCLLVQLLGT